jgi:hypothetical protein
VAVTARILYDRYKFGFEIEAGLIRIRALMQAGYHHISESSVNDYLPETLIARALDMVRQDGEHERFEKVLVLVDESDSANQVWPPHDGQSVFSVLTRATLHRSRQTKDMVTLFVTSLHIRAFDIPGSPSLVMVPYEMAVLDPVEIRDKLLKLPFGDQQQALKDQVTRFLSVLAPLPRVVDVLEGD